METIIKEQNVRIILETKLTLSYGTSPKILYKKPDGTEGNWTATILGTTILFDAEQKEIDQVGTWYVHTQVNLGGDTNPTFGARAMFLVKDKFTK